MINLNVSTATSVSDKFHLFAINRSFDKSVCRLIRRLHVPSRLPFHCCYYIAQVSVL